MKVPMLNLAAQNASVRDEVRAAIDRVLDSQSFILGPDVEAFENEIARFCDVPHAIGVGSGSDAILATLMALDIGPGDEVIVPTFTFFATAGCVSRVGAKPVFVDIQPDTFNIDPDATAAAITPRTRAIIPVHLYGQCADMDRIMALAERHGLAVIEDAAQALGAAFGDRPAGSIGTAGTFSFYPTKNLSAMGEAGMIVTRDDALAGKLRFVRDHGQNPRYYYHCIGGNFRLDGFQGAILRVKLQRLDQWNEQRRRHAGHYDTALNGQAIVAPPIDPRCRHIYHQYTVRCAQRDMLQQHLSEAGVGSAVYYPLCLHQQPCFAYVGNKEGDCPVAEQAAREVLSLPICPEMTGAQRDYVIEALTRFVPAVASQA